MMIYFAKSPKFLLIKKKTLPIPANPLPKCTTAVREIQNATLNRTITSARIPFRLRVHTDIKTLLNNKFIFRLEMLTRNPDGEMARNFRGD